MSERFLIVHPKITTENKIAVYKLSFDCGMFYIGSSINLARRIVQYRYNLYNRNDINKKLKLALNSHNSATISIIEVCKTEEEVRAREDYHIKLNFDDINFLNRSKSAYSNRVVVFSKEERYAHGNGMRGKKLTPEQLQRFSDAQKGKKHTEATKKLLSEMKKGFKFSDEHKAKLSKAKKGITLSDERKLVMKNSCTTKIKVDMYDINGVYIKTFDSFKDAGKEIGTQAGHIGEVVRGKYKSLKGFIFALHNHEQKDNTTHQP